MDTNRDGNSRFTSLFFVVIGSIVRIISGEQKGHIIRTPANLPVRPTTDLAKESLFNILENRFSIDKLSLICLQVPEISVMNFAPEEFIK